jgi:hypothetical protein
MSHFNNNKQILIHSCVNMDQCFLQSCKPLGTIPDDVRARLRKLYDTNLSVLRVLQLLQDIWFDVLERTPSSIYSYVRSVQNATDYVAVMKPSHTDWLPTIVQVEQTLTSTAAKRRAILLVMHTPATAWLWEGKARVNQQINPNVSLASALLQSSILCFPDDNQVWVADAFARDIEDPQVHAPIRAAMQHIADEIPDLCDQNEVVHRQHYMQCDRCKYYNYTSLILCPVCKLLVCNDCLAPQQLCVSCVHIKQYIHRWMLRARA